MTRAEQAARNAYPINKPKIICKEAQKILQEVYSEGYEQAEKDTIERACEYLFKHYAVNLDEFRKAMEEE